MAQPWVLATRNPGKLRELRDIFDRGGIRAIELVEAGVPEDASAEDAVESFSSFEENALAKARYYARRLPGRVVVADDSGLVVDALGGEPGVRSKRWAGHAATSGSALDAANNGYLMQHMSGVVNRAARFVCVAAAVDGVSEWIARAEVAGMITHEPRGAHGFGYDPYFFVEELGMTLAESTLEQKRSVSHRARAFARLLELMS